MKVLVTGPRGFIASTLIREMNESGRFQVFTLDRDQDPRPIFEKNSIDAVIHLATKFLKAHTLDDVGPLIDSNLKTTAQLLECSAKYGVKHFVTFGTFYEFPKPISLYAATKAAMAPLLEYYSNHASLRITELYIYDSYGPADPRVKVVNVFVKSAKSGEEMLLTPGLQKMKLLHVRDACSAILHTIEKLPPSAHKNDVARYALEPLECLTLKDIAQKVEKATNSKLNAKWGAREYTPGVQMDPSLPFPALPGWKAQISLDQGLVEVAKNC